jgi:ketosteroid isomerase-like protein
MKAIFAPAFLGTAALIAAAPLAAEEQSPEQAEVIAAADAFFAALRSDDKTALAGVMLSEGVIFIHNRMNPAAPRVDAVPVADHLARWAKGTRMADEEMHYETVLVNGDMAQVWGPYSFWSDYELTHCGINSLSMVKTESGWKVANTSFTMERPSECERLGVPGFPADEARDDTP